MGGINDDQINASVNQRLGSGKARIADGGGGGNP